MLFAIRHSEFVRPPPFAAQRMGHPALSLLGSVFFGEFVVIFRAGGFGYAIGAVEPAAKIDHLASLTTERAIRRVLVAVDGGGLLAGWTMKGRQSFIPDYSHRRERGERRVSSEKSL